jgi:hypothetical protein
VKVPLLTVLEHCLIDAVCEVGVDLSLAVQNDHLATMIAFVGGLGNAHSLFCSRLIPLFAEPFMLLLIAACLPACVPARLPIAISLLPSPASAASISLSLPLIAYSSALLVLPS